MKCPSPTTARSAGVFHDALPFSCHCWSTSCTWVASTTPAMSTRASCTPSASVPRIGPEVITGDAIRTRCSASAMRLAISCASFSPRFGENHARTGFRSTSTGVESTFPLRSTSRVVHSCSKSVSNRCATSRDSTVTTTFSCRVHESSVQFIDPLQTDVPSRITYLWCIRSGQPGTPTVANGSCSIRLGSVCGGGGTGTRRSRSTL